MAEHGLLLSRKGGRQLQSTRKHRLATALMLPPVDRVATAHMLPPINAVATAHMQPPTEGSSTSMGHRYTMPGRRVGDTMQPLGSHPMCLLSVRPAALLDPAISPPSVPGASQLTTQDSLFTMEVFFSCCSEQWD